MGVSLHFMGLPRWLFALALVVLLASCGGGGSGSSADASASSRSGTDATASTGPATAAAPNDPAFANVLPVTVDRGIGGVAINTPFVSVTVCEPGTANCRTVDHVLVDTGSYGLRLAASAIDSTFRLPAVMDVSGVAVGECAQFASGWAWGSVRRADVGLAGEKAGNIPIQVVGDPAAAYATVPSGCRNLGADIGVGLGANGILGVGMQALDCGPACVSSTAPTLYFACRVTGCVSTTLPLSSQVANPVRSFATNNNGVILMLPPVPPGGAPALFGSLIFGIDTQPNNRLGPETVYQADSLGNFATTYKGVTYPSSFIDSGSNAIFFPDSSIPQCFDFYCPPTPLALSAVNRSVTGVSGTVDFTVESFASVSGNAAAHLAGDIGLTRSFDWGLPFFFGRKVFVAMTGATTSKGTGPFWAY